MTDRNGNSRRFDPRFDPAFQPGYDPASDPTAAARALSGGSAQPAPAVMHLPLAPTAPTHVPVGALAVSVDTTDVRNVPGHAVEARAENAVPGSGVNPFLIALWAVSVLLVAVGGGLLRMLPSLAETVQTSTTASYDFYTVQAVMIGAPMLVVLGIAAATGILFVHAAKWKKSPSAPESSDGPH